MHLLKLAPEQGECLRDWSTDIRGGLGFGLWSCETSKATHKAVNSVDFGPDYLREIVSKVGIRISLGEQFCERLDGDERILDLMGNTRDQRAERREALRCSLFILERLNLREVTKNNKGAYDRAVLVPKSRGRANQGSSAVSVTSVKPAWESRWLDP